MNKLVALVLLYFSAFGLMAQNEIWMRPNKGQWHENISYKVGIPGGNLFLEKTGFTYALTSEGEHYDHGHGHEDEPELIKNHVVRTTFVGANPNPVFQENNPSSFYENYFLGNDPSKWVKHSFAYNEIVYSELYKNIDLQLYENKSTLKYDVIVRPDGNPSDFKVHYDGQDNLSIVDGTLKIQTSLGSIIEGKPFAYQTIAGIKKEVTCHYQLIGNEMTFVFPNGYDESVELIIDPDLTFSTFTGATSDNWGMTACPDADGKLIGAGVVFSSGYPLSTGAFDNTFNGGSVDIGLTKFNDTGGDIIYSTFIGGSGGETPNSIITSETTNELYMMGATSSSDFPVGSSPYQGSNNGGSTASVNGIGFTGGSDIFILKIAPNGDAVLGGTYLGGSEIDGISEGGTPGFLLSLVHNYGDQLRGEIILDDDDNVFITSSTQSTDFPVVGGFDATLGGDQDAIAAKFNTNLTNLLWSTYIGGDDLESGNSLKVSSTGDLFVAGGTKSINLPATGGKLHSTYRGGEVDGFVMKFPGPTYAGPEATYLGTTDYDQAYFIELDIDDFVYVYGQSSGNYQTDGDNYINPNSGQFIHKISNDLTTTGWSSVFGAGTGEAEISPTAFLVSDCYEIYIAGWGGNTNIADASTTSGFPTTSDAYLPTTSGSNFYLAVFDQDMQELKYGTFMGDPSLERDHVDGGTSRFDKSGTIYHAVCAACGGNDNGFPTTPGSFSPTNPSPNCNMAVFQFELSQIEAVLGTGAPVICIPDPVIFENESENGNSFEWDFGDGSPTSTEFEPTHFYEDPGDYTVTLIVSDINGCYTPDTAEISVTIALFEGEAGSLSDTICPGSSVELFAIGGDSYSWGPSEFLDDPFSAEPIATITEATTFTVIISSVCGMSEVDVTVHVFGTDASSGLDTAICVGGEAQLSASGGETYLWEPAETLDDPTSDMPNASPPITTVYTVEITTPEGCLIEDSIKVIVDQDLPFPNLINEVSICFGDSIRITAGGATSYLWTPDYNISDVNLHDPFVYPEVDTSYAVTFTNACGSSFDTVDVNVIRIIAEIAADTTICPTDSAFLWASGGEFYDWSPGAFLTNDDQATTISIPPHDITYSVIVSDEFGCFDSASVTVSLYDLPSIVVSPSVFAIVGDTVEISADGIGSIAWSPPTFIDCITCPTTFVYPESETTYKATITDSRGCRNIGFVPILFDPLIYVPNTFTPDGDGFNNTFKAIAHNIDEFQMQIFNRWGELIYTMIDLEDAWDATYKGYLVTDEVYVWQIAYTDLKGIPHQLKGHVVVLK